MDIFMVSLLDLECVCLCICAVLISVASFAQKLFLGSYLALCAAIKVGFA